MKEANAVMFVVIVFVAIGAMIIWLFPEASAYVAQVLTARSVALRAAREAYQREYRRVMPGKGEAAALREAQWDGGPPPGDGIDIGELMRPEAGK